MTYMIFFFFFNATLAFIFAFLVLFDFWVGEMPSFLKGINAL